MFVPSYRCVTTIWSCSCLLCWLHVYSPPNFFFPDLVHSGLSCSFSETSHLCCCQYLYYNECYETCVMRIRKTDFPPPIWHHLSVPALQIVQLRHVFDPRRPKQNSAAYRHQCFQGNHTVSHIMSVHILTLCFLLKSLVGCSNLFYKKMSFCDNTLIIVTYTEFLS